MGPGTDGDLHVEREGHHIDEEYVAETQTSMEHGSNGILKLVEMVGTA